MAKLINGNGNPAVYAAEDADMLAGIMGNVTTITAVGNEFAATASGANLIEVADGVILTQEGRRIQLDAGITDAFTIPSGTAGTTNYYIIGYRLYESASGTQECETFVQLMASSTDTIPEDTFRGGATEVFVSLYRVEQDGVNLGTITSLLPKVSGVSQINNDLTKKALVNTYYDSSTKKLYQVNADGTQGGEISMGKMKCAKFGDVTPTSSNSVVTINIADLNLSSAEDYMVIISGQSSNNGIVNGKVVAKTATSFGIYFFNSTVSCSYQVITFV